MTQKGGQRRETSCQTNVLISIPQAYECVEPWRSELDPSARLGVPPHITLLYPWVEPSSSSLHILDSIVRQVRPFELTFSSVKTFPATIWLAPTPTAPVTALIAQLQAAFPFCVPYGGRHSRSRPHLTVANGVHPDSHRGAQDDLRSKLPLVVEVRGLEVWAEAAPGGTWRLVQRLSFGNRQSRSLVRRAG